MKCAIPCVLGLIGAMSLMTAVAASAQPSGPLIETTCSYAQLEAAVAVEAPEASDRLADNPDARAKVQALLGLPIDQRRQRVQSFLDRNPDVAAMIEQKRNTPEGQDKLLKMQRIANTCHDY